MNSGVKGCVGFSAAVCAGALGLAACGSSSSTKTDPPHDGSPRHDGRPTTPTTVNTSTSGGVSY